MIKSGRYFFPVTCPGNINDGKNVSIIMQFDEFTAKDKLKYQH